MRIRKQSSVKKKLKLSEMNSKMQSSDSQKSVKQSKSAENSKKKTLETLSFQGFLIGAPSGTRTRDPLIKSDCPFGQPDVQM